MVWTYLEKVENDKMQAFIDYDKLLTVFDKANI